MNTEINVNKPWQERAQQWVQHKGAYPEGSLWGSVLGLLSEALESDKRLQESLANLAEEELQTRDAGVKIGTENKRLREALEQIQITTIEPIIESMAGSALKGE